MSPKKWWGILGILAAIALGVHITWVVVLAGLDIHLPAVVVFILIFFPGGMGWLMPLGFAWLWKDEIRRTDPDPGTR